MTPRLRLRSQLLVGARARTPREAVAALVGLQGQDLESAKWAVGLRVPGSSEADVVKAFSSGALVRTWPMRGTLHVVAAEDVRWLLALTLESNLKRAAHRRRQLGLDEKTTAKSRKVLERALGDSHLTREELFTALARAKISTEGQRGYHLLWDAAVNAVLCSGAPRGKVQTFALLDAWLPRTKVRPHDEALAELALRYFSSRGPATLKDFTWWCGLPVREARAALASVSAQLERVDESSFAALGVKEASGPTVLALPGFDELLLGYQDRSASLEKRHAPRICPGGNGMFLPTLVVDGRVVGTWKRATRQLELFAPLSARLRPLAEEALERYAVFLGQRE